MRAAFIAAKCKTQVLVIAPTTILARQHYETFSKRSEDENISIGHLSRLTKDKEKKNISSKLKDGTIDIVIGTHSLLSNKILFKNLCLVIIDEEQRFGVTQKEKLKNLLVNFHILTLTATPILELCTWLYQELRFIYNSFSASRKITSKIICYTI